MKSVLELLAGVPLSVEVKVMTAEPSTPDSDLMLTVLVWIPGRAAPRTMVMLASLTRL